MMPIDLVGAIAVACSLCIVVVVFFWHAGAGRRRGGSFLDPRFIWHCSVCTYSYVNTKDEHICQCPRCGSYNKK